MNIVFRPLTGWPGRLRDDDERQTGYKFKATWTATTNLVQYEAGMIGGDLVVIQIAIAETEIRRDGWPYLRAVPRHPGVTIVVPESAHGRLSWSTDLYQSWQANVRAIGLTMEALRAADRHDVMRGRQYAGFRELPSGIAMPERQMTVEDAARFIVEHSDWQSHGKPIPTELAVAELLHKGHQLPYLRAAKKLHPDLGGDPQLFQRLQDAKRILDEHGGRP